MEIKVSNKELKSFIRQIYSYEIGIFNVIYNMIFYKFKDKKELSIALFNYLNTKTHKDALNKYNYIECWDVSNIKDMSNLFSFHNNEFTKSLTNDNNLLIQMSINFNEDISSWNVSNVENMAYMFEWCKSFNQNIGKWDVSKVKYMVWMFSHNNLFNQSLNDWNINKVQYFNYMFYSCREFNKPLKKWKIKNMGKEKKIGMFGYCYRFDKKENL